MTYEEKLAITKTISYLMDLLLNAEKDKGKQCLNT